MTQFNRRSVLATTGLGMLFKGVLKGWGSESARDSQAAKAQDEGGAQSLPLAKYQPVSMVHLKETHVPRARYPVIDFHTHLTDSAKAVNGVSLGAERVIAAPPNELLPVMEAGIFSPWLTSRAVLERVARYSCPVRQELPQTLLYLHRTVV